MPRIDPPHITKGDRGEPGRAALVSDLEPAEPQIGDIWVDTDDNPANLYNLPEASQVAIQDEVTAQLAAEPTVVQAAADAVDANPTIADHESRITANTAKADRADTRVVDVRKFGAVGDGVTSDAAAFQSAIDNATAHYDATGAGSVITGAARKYRIDTTLLTTGYITYDFPGSQFIGPITGADVISASLPTIPAATDVAGQIAGACFSDAGTGTIYGVTFKGMVFNGFRHAVLSRAAWNHPVFEGVRFVSGNCGFFAYQGCQQPLFRNIGASSMNTIVMAGVTAFVAGHPYADMDNYYCDALHFSTDGQEVACVANANWDSWVEQALLRPSDTSQVTGFSGTYAPTGTFLKASGRIIYVPMRNTRSTYKWNIGPLHSYYCPRGAVLTRRPLNAVFHDISGEQMFGDAAVNTGPDESVVVVGVDNIASTAEFRNIDASTSATGTNYKGAIDVVVTGTSWGTRFVAENITGWLDPEYFTRVSQQAVSGGGFPSFVTTSRGERHTPVARKAADSLSGAEIYRPALGEHRALWHPAESTFELREHLFAGRLPLVGGSETNAKLSISGTPSANGAAQVLKGYLDLLVERLDTGEIDAARYLVVLSQRFGNTTLAADVTAGATTITVASGSGLSPGTPITLNATEKALVKSVAGNTVTLNQPLVGSFTSGQAVTAAASILRTDTPLTNTWVTVSISSGLLMITNNINPVPIVYHARITSPMARF